MHPIFFMQSYNEFIVLTRSLKREDWIPEQRDTLSNIVNEDIKLGRFVKDNYYYLNIYRIQLYRFYWFIPHRLVSLGKVSYA